MADYSTLGIRLATSNILIGAVQGGFAPTPRGRRSTGFPIGPIGTGRAAATGEVGTTIERDVGGEDTQLGGAPSAPSAPSSLTGYAAQVRNAVVGKIESQFAFPTALNPLTGTVRATGVSPVLGAMMPSFMQALGVIGYQANMANLTGIAQQTSIGTPGYGVGMLNNQMVGTSPAFGISGTSTMSGIIGSPPGIVSMSDYTDAIKSALLSSTVTTYGPARAVAMGLSPQATYGLPDITSAVATSLYGWDTSAGTGSVLGGYKNAFSGVVTSIDQTTGLPTPVRSFDYETQTWSGTVKSPTSDIGLTAKPGEFGYTAGQGAGTLGSLKSGAGIGPTMGSTTGLGMETGRDPETNSGTSSSSSSSPSGGSSSDASNDGSGGTAFKSGGRVDYAPGGNVTNGFVNKDPDSVTEQESIADNRFTSVKEGSFIVNQPTNEKYEGMLDSLVAKAEKKVKKPKDAPMVDVALSDGERHIEPEVVAQIEKMKGKGFLDKLNNKGKPEVKRRQAKYGGGVGLNEGGFLEQGMEVQDVGDDIPMQDYIPVSDELISKISKFASKKPQRGQIKQFIKSLSDEDKLTVLFLTETQSTTDPIESMEAIGEVVQNRMSSDYYDFKDIKTLDDALLKQTRRGAFHFSGLEPSTLYARAKEVKKGTASKGLAKAAAAAQNILNPETEGYTRLPANTLFYTRKDAPSQWMRESKDLEFSTELGEHEFYRTFKTREFP
jgi:hypothetical protein